MYSAYETIFHASPEKQLKIYDLFLKFPSILADLAIGVLIYFCVSRYTKKKHALLAMSLFIFNPVIIYNSAVWGQVDAINNLFLYCSLLFLLSRKYFLTIFTFFLCLYVKISLLPLLPLILLLALKETKYDYKKIFIFTITSIAALLIFTLPVSNSPLIWIINFLEQNSSGQLQHIANYCFNFWSLIFNPDYFANIPLSSEIFYGLSLETWAYLIFFVVSIPLLFWALRNKTLDAARLFGVCMLTTFAMFLFLPRMHERYLYPLFPLFATYIGLKGKYYLEFLLATLLNFIGLYVAWHPSDFLPTLITGIIVHSKVRLGMSGLIVALFIVLYARIVLKRETLKSFFRKIYPIKDV
jgi:Gpi18-like mannosyltransferase